MSYHSRHCSIPNASARNDPDPACTCGQAARAAVYAARREAIDDASKDPAVDAAGAALTAAGWQQTSLKYRRVTRVPSGDALAELERLGLHDEVERVRADANRYMQDQARGILWRHGETRELDPALFAAFRRHAKRSAL